MAERTESEFVGGSMDGFTTATPADVVAIATIRQVDGGLFTELSIRRGTGLSRAQAEAALLFLLLDGAGRG